MKHIESLTPSHISYIEGISSDHLVSLYVECQAGVFLELFTTEQKFLVADLDFGYVGLVSAKVTGTVPMWAALCRKYSNEEVVKSIEHYFYTQHFAAWVTEGMV